MRLLYFTRTYTAHDYRFLQAFQYHGLEIGYLALRDAAAAISRLQLPAGIEILGNLGMQADASGPQLDAVVAPFKVVAETFVPDAILAGPITDCAYIAAKASLLFPLIAISWAFDVLWESKGNIEVAQRTQLALRSCSALFADCSAVVARCEQIIGRKLPARFIMPWGIDLAEVRHPRSREAIRRELGIERRWVFLHTRGFEPIYSVKTLLDSFLDFHKAHTETLLLLVSDGSMRPLVEHFIEKHALSKAVTLIGTVTHARMLDLFCAADCYISCALSDGTSVSLLEAMALGLQPIINDVGGNTEWIHDKQNGWVVPVGNVNRLAQAMSAAINLDPDGRRRFAEQNWRLVEAKANWSDNFRGFLEFLNKCIRQPKKIGTSVSSL